MEPRFNEETHYSKLLQFISLVAVLEELRGVLWITKCTSSESVYDDKILESLNYVENLSPS
jgi:hypothetical protein